MLHFVCLDFFVVFFKLIFQFNFVVISEWFSRNIWLFWPGFDTIVHIVRYLLLGANWRENNSKEKLEFIWKLALWTHLVVIESKFTFVNRNFIETLPNDVILTLIRNWFLKILFTPNFNSSSNCFISQSLIDNSINTSINRYFYESLDYLTVMAPKKHTKLNTRNCVHIIQFIKSHLYLSLKISFNNSDRWNFESSFNFVLFSSKLSKCTNRIVLNNTKRINEPFFIF